MKMQGVQKHILICSGKTCIKNGGEQVAEAIREEIKEMSLTKFIHTTKTLCNGQCKNGAITILYPDGIWYKEMNEDSGRKLIKEISEVRPLEQNIILDYKNHQFVEEETE
ncbi:cobalamin biosynthesis protein [Bacillus endophyticus]|uniref:(2Fe-2S) ferredoxin domain-containing protein n=1 Tax=Priestia endophytica TaxID=135735 RepID=UPI0018CC9BB0|nr:(2Fe-2S) ferredoxin domain-containing protein [Priestia endophytica]MBG9812779.1 cobalamin biosynthesis protein [Priestia endophytica]